LVFCNQGVFQQICLELDIFSGMFTQKIEQIESCIPIFVIDFFLKFLSLTDKVDWLGIGWHSCNLLDNSLGCL